MGPGKMEWSRTGVGNVEGVVEEDVEGNVEGEGGS
jgi:hypothetical protein